MQNPWEYNTINIACISEVEVSALFNKEMESSELKKVNHFSSTMV